MRAGHRRRRRRGRRRPHPRGAGALGRDADDTGRRPAARRVLVEWLAKLSLLEGYRNRDGLDWDDARLGLWTCNGPTSGRKKASTTGCLARDRMQRHRRRRRDRPRRDGAAVGHPRLLPRDVRQHFGTTWSAPAGTRSSSTFPDRGGCSVSRPGNRCAAPKPSPGPFARHRDAGPFLAELLGSARVHSVKGPAGARAWQYCYGSPFETVTTEGEKQWQARSSSSRSRGTTEVDEDVPAAPPPRRKPRLGGHAGRR